MKSKRRKKFNILILFIYILSIFAFYEIKSSSFIDFKIGEAANADVESQYTFENVKATELKKEQARNSVPDIYKVLPNIQVETKSTVAELGSTVFDLRFRSDVIEDEKINYLKTGSPIPLGEDDYKYLLNTSYKNATDTITIANELLNSSFLRGIKDIELENEKKNLLLSVDNVTTDEDMAEVIKNIIKAVLIPNEVVDEELTQKAKKDAEEKVEPVIINKGDKILLKGEILTKEKAELLQQSGNSILTEQERYYLKIKPIVTIFVSTLILVLYIYLTIPKVYMSNRFYVLLITDIIILGLSVYLNEISVLYLPILLLCLITVLYVDFRLSLLNVSYMIVLISMMGELNSDAIIYMLILSSTVQIFGSKFTEKSFVISIAIFSSLIATLIYNFMIFNEFIANKFLLNLGIGIINGILSSIIALGTSILWENTFGILTNGKLNELLDTNKPILKELLEKAPGTYQHSLMVANLAENAAKKIDANYTLVKVGCFYHDIGKIKNPKFFSENQLGINPHNQLKPIESSKIIVSHVTDGVIFAKKYKLPKEVIDFIEEHHGTTTTNYFYYMAKNENPDISSDLFRYNGRKPQSVETAIVMIADSCEAAVRALKEKTPENIEKLVNSIIEDKVDQKQFVECDLTFNNIESIKAVLIDNFLSIYHERIEYPEKME